MRTRKPLLIVSLLVLVCLFAARSAFACTSIPVGKNASVDGSVMTSHTCDGGYDHRLIIVPAADYKSGAMRPVYKGGGSSPDSADPWTKVGEIPQVAHTYRYINIAYPFMNEHQVMMGETTIGGRKELQNPNGYFEIWELQRIGLERAQTAREAIQIMGSLAEKYGYGDNGECLTVADGKEVWQFEIFGAGPLEVGSVWAAKRIPDDQVGVSANRSRIGALNLADTNNFMASKNVLKVAQDMGWWDGQGQLVFNKVYGPKSSFYNSRREWRVLSMLAPSLKLDPWADEFPFSIKPDKKVSVKDIMALNRDHYEGTEFDLTKGPAAGPFGNPNRYATAGNNWERAISIFRCTYSIVTQSRSWLPDEIGGVVWFGEDSPQSTCYIPIYSGVTKMPDSFTIGRRDVFDRNCAWWAFDFVSNWADLKYSYIIKDIQAAAASFEGQAFAMQPAIESAAKELYAKDPALANQFLTTYCYDLANRVVTAWWQLADTLIVKYNDGYVNYKSVGYPDEWLKAVGYGPIAKPK